MNDDRPDAGSLLETASRVLREEILPDVAPERTLDLLMVARCMEIAARALSDSSDLLDGRRLDRFAELTGASGDPASLAAAIRAGDWDTPARARRLHACLVEDTRERLARVNPRYLGIMESEESM